QQPTNTLAGNSITPAVALQVLDPFNNLVAWDKIDTVTLALGNNPTGATLSGTLTVSVSSGVATFSNLSLNKAGNGYTLTATSGTLGTLTSAPFNITPTKATQLAFGQNPVNSAAGTSITPAARAWARERSAPAAARQPPASPPPA